MRCPPQICQAVLSHGEGLWLGPDSDGLLNYCDAGRASLSAATSQLQQQAGPEQSAGKKRKQRSEGGGASAAAVVQWPQGIKDVASLLSSISIVADRFVMPKAKPPEGMISTPRAFQLQVSGGQGEER